MYKVKVVYISTIFGKINIKKPEEIILACAHVLE